MLSVGLLLGEPWAVTPIGRMSERWYKGNTHTHSRECGDSAATPAYVSRWYRERGYNFLVISEHNRYIPEARLKSARLYAGRKRHPPGDFILIPGEEVTESAPFRARVVHVTGINTRRLVSWKARPRSRTHLIQTYVDRVRAAGGIAVLNHPNLSWSLTASDIRTVRKLRLFELYNSHPHASNFGDKKHASTEQLWDRLLTDGMVLYGVASDDAHCFRFTGRGYSNPGRAWIVVRARALTPARITESIRRGRFYSSTGVVLRVLSYRRGLYRIVVDERASIAQATRPNVFGDESHAKSPVRRIEFIGPGGRVLKRVNGLAASFRPRPGTAYVRVRVTISLPVQIVYGKKEQREFYAWTQPIFHDGRLRK